MPNLDEINNWLQDRLPGLLAEHQVPGAAIAVSVGGQVIDLAAGVLSKATRVEATADSVFQVGSITKLWTSTLVMQLADEGKLEIDAPVRRYLPEFGLADEQAASEITVRQLLCPTAGFEATSSPTRALYDDCVEKYVATLHAVPQLFAPGEMFSYNNAGFCVHRTDRGSSARQALRRLCPRSSVHAAGPYPPGERGAGSHPVPGGRRAHPAGTGRRAGTGPGPLLARSNAPAGAMLTMRPRDLLGFARMHMSGGLAPDGTTVLTAASVKAMQQEQVRLPHLGLMGSAWGLGWEIFDWPGGTVIGHDGGTIGQSAFLRLVPGRDVAIALLTNGGNAAVGGLASEGIPAQISSLDFTSYHRAATTSATFTLRARASCSDGLTASGCRE